MPSPQTFFDTRAAKFDGGRTAMADRAASAASTLAELRPFFINRFAERCFDETAEMLEIIAGELRD